MIKGLFFDFDGTINDAKKLAFDSMSKAISEMGFDFDKDRLRELLGTKTPNIIRELGIQKKYIESTKKLFYKYFIYGAKNGKTHRCGNLSPLLRIKLDIPMIVISNAETAFVKSSMDSLGVTDMFNEVYGGESFDTKDKLLKKLLKKMKINPSEAIYIGDRFSDIDYAKKAGCLAVAIHNKYSWSSLDLIKKEEPDYIIKNFFQLRKLVNKLNKTQ